MHITLFGGSFNPPHLGHALVLHDFIKAQLSDQVWLLPTKHHPFEKPLETTNHRLDMTKIFLEHLYQISPISEKNLKLCTIELDLELSGKTFDTVNELKQNQSYLKEHQLPNHNTYSFLMGSDQLLNFSKWHQYQGLLAETSFWVYPREGHQMTPLFDNMQIFKTKDQVITNISSTLARAQIQNKADTSLLIPNPILEYIRQERLYE